MESVFAADRGVGLMAERRGEIEFSVACGRARRGLRRGDRRRAKRQREQYWYNTSESHHLYVLRHGESPASWVAERAGTYRFLRGEGRKYSTPWYSGCASAI